MRRDFTELCAKLQRTARQAPSSREAANGTEETRKPLQRASRTVTRVIHSAEELAQLSLQAALSLTACASFGRLPSTEQPRFSRLV